MHTVSFASSSLNHKAIQKVSISTYFFYFGSCTFVRLRSLSKDNVRASFCCIVLFVIGKDSRRTHFKELLRLKP